MRARLLRTGLPVLAAALALAGCSGDDDTPQGPRPAAVALKDLKVDGDLRIGLLVTLDSAPGQGDALLPAASGAQVAVERLTLGGSKVSLDVQDDRGTADGAVQAIERFVADGVGGIVVASTGDHLDDALAAASKAGVPVIAPYLRDADGLPAGVWLTGPDDRGVAAATQRALDADKLLDPFVITADGVSAPVDGLEGSAGTDRPERVVAQVRTAVKEQRADSVVVAAAPETQASIVAGLQGALPDLPIVLTPEALTPVFATRLVDDGGTPADELTSVGLDATDATTLAQGPQADAAAAYFTALRLMADDPDATDVFGSTPFAQVADGADIASHDAVIALATAAASAGSVAPADVEKALDGLTVEAADGLAGPALDFSTPVALDQSDVVALISTSQDPGVRPAVAGADPGLHWFAIPVEQG